MTSGRAEQALNGGHVVCLRDKEITEIRDTVALMNKRMFQDNGHDSIQTSLVQGAARFKRIDDNMESLKTQVVSLSAHVASLADVVRQGNTLQQGLAGEELTTEALVRQVLKEIPKTGTSGSAMWLSLAVVAVCVTIIVLKVV